MTEEFDDTERAFRPSVSSFDPSEGRACSTQRPSKLGRGTKTQAKRRLDTHEEDSEKRHTSSHDAFQRIIALCTVRDRSARELAERLAREGYDDAHIDEALEHAQSCGLVDDQRFADAFIRGRISAGKGELIIKRDLKKHGIELESVFGWPQDFAMSEEEQLERASQILKTFSCTSKDPYSSARRKLESRGYSSAIAHRAVEAWLDTQDLP